MAEARQRLLAGVKPVPSEEVPLDESLGRVLAGDLFSTVLVPPFANSAMDGFAVRSADTQAASATVTLRVIGTVQAGAPLNGEIGPRQAARIMTGAPLPAGADAVVPFEEARVEGDDVTISACQAARACVRPAGLDVKPGDRLLGAGTRMSPAGIALAASIGRATVTVRRGPVVAILATGDELVEPGNPLTPGQIYNSNAHGLAAAVRELGAEPNVLNPARDDEAALRETLTSITEVDLVLTSGGVSVGDFDYVKKVIEEEGDIAFWRIKMRPGKPLMLGWLRGLGDSSTPILGLPGNPTSTMVTFYIFARPLILTLMGAADPVPQPILAVTEDELDNRGGRETYFRVVLETRDGRPTVRLAGGQDSSMLVPLARANALARVPEEEEGKKPGDQVEVLRI